MKCVCGYEGEDFKPIKVYINFPALIIVDGKDVEVYACPECGTLKIEVKE
jgi:hypothetical protein